MLSDKPELTVLVQAIVARAPYPGVSRWRIQKELSYYWTKQYAASTIQNVLDRLREKKRIQRIKTGRKDRWVYSSYRDISDLQLRALEDVCFLLFERKRTEMKKFVQRHF